MIVLLAKLAYWWHWHVHGRCEKRIAQSHWQGYIRGAQDERSLIRNAALERQLRDAIKDAGW